MNNNNTKKDKKREKSIDELLEENEEKLEELREKDDDINRKISDIESNIDSIDMEFLDEFVGGATALIYSIATIACLILNIVKYNGGGISTFIDSLVSDVLSAGWPFYGIICGPVIVGEMGQFITSLPELGIFKIKSKMVKNKIDSEQKKRYELLSKKSEKIETNEKDNSSKVAKETPIVKEKTINSKTVDSPIKETSNGQEQQVISPVVESFAPTISSDKPIEKTDNKAKVLVKVRTVKNNNQ